MRVCFVTEDFYPSFIGGQGAYGKELVQSLEKKGVDVTVLAEKRAGREAYWKSLPVKVFLVPFCFGNQLLLALFEYLYFVFNLSKTSFDLVHANQLSGLFFVLCKPKNVKKVVMTVHNTYWDMYRTSSLQVKKLQYRMLMVLEKFVYEHVDGLVFYTQVGRETLQKKYNVSHIPFVVAPLGAENITFTKQEKDAANQAIRKRFKLTNEFIVLYVGRLVKRKKVDILVNALALLEKEQFPVAGVIVGQGAERLSLQKIASANTHFTGFVESTRKYFLAADCFVNMSVGEGGIVLTALEAASFGLPLLLSHESADTSVLIIGENGYVVSQSAKELAEKIKYVLTHREKFGRESREIVRRLSWEKTARQTAAFYSQLQKI